MAQDLTPGKSACILAVVLGCFAILWPSIFYPMLKSSILPSGDNENGCCHVLLDKDVNGVKLVLDLCHAVLKKSEKFDIASNRLDNKAIKRCCNLMNSTCGVDIQSLLKDKIRLDPSYKFTLEQLRTVNKSFCLKYHFNINLDVLGAPHRLKKLDFISSSKYNRQERPPYHRPNAIHPAMLERGRAVPQPHIPIKSQRERISPPPPPVLAAKKPPLPGMRPPMGGAGHVPPQKGSGPVGVLMPLYTIGIVIFFVYTLTKLVCRKQDNSSQYIHDPDFSRLVFQKNGKESREGINEKSNGSITSDTSKLVVSAISSLLQEVNHDILKREMKNDQREIRPTENSNPDENCLEKPVENEIDEKRTVADDSLSEISSHEVNGLIQVVGMETNESCENGQPWKHFSADSRKKSSTLNDVHEEIIADEIILSANVPMNSQILISDASTRNVADEPSVILESKVTLNVISNDLKEAVENGDDEESKNDETEENISMEYKSGRNERRDSFDREGIPSTEL